MLDRNIENSLFKDDGFKDDGNMKNTKIKNNVTLNFKDIQNNYKT